MRFAPGLLLALAACTPAASSLDAPSREPIAAVWRAKCGACHAPVEPGTRDPDALSAALGRHRKRVRLTEPEWVELARWLGR